MCLANKEGKGGFVSGGMDDYSFSWHAVNICSSPLLDRDPGRVGLPSMLLHPCQTTNINK